MGTQQSGGRAVRGLRVAHLALGTALLGAACERAAPPPQTATSPRSVAPDPPAENAGEIARGASRATTADAGASAAPVAASDGTNELPSARAVRIPFTGPGREVAARLPAPFASTSADNPPRVVARPEGAALTAPPGFRVDEYARDLPGARWLAVAPNGDVFVSDHEHNQVLVLRDADHDGRAETRAVFTTSVRQPFGMAFREGYLYVANTDSVARFRYASGDTRARSGPERLLDLPGGGYHQHWTRDVVFAPDGRTMFVSVGSQTNASVEPDARRAAVSAYDPDGRHHRVFASGLRNAVGLAVHPTTGVLYAVVNERDELGDDLVPDYLTSVREGAFYGWPYSYFGQHEDPRLRGQGAALMARAVVPDVALGPHVAALGLLFYTGAQFPDAYRNDALVSLHGSWNRAARVGYMVVRARFRDGAPTGELEEFVTGWALPDGRVWGRPVGLAQLPDGSVLIMDDGAEVLWRVSYATGATQGAGASATTTGTTGTTGAATTSSRPGPR